MKKVALSKKIKMEFDCGNAERVLLLKFFFIQFSGSFEDFRFFSKIG